MFCVWRRFVAGDVLWLVTFCEVTFCYWSGCGVSPYWTPGASWFRALDNPYRALACISWYRIPVSLYRTLEVVG
jgi:hypothetical protein